jgi:hypothetical protein
LFSGTWWVGNLVVFVILFCEVLEDAAGFEKTYLLPIGEGVYKSWNASVRIDLEEPRLFLGVLANINVLDFVRLAMQVSIGNFPLRVSNIPLPALRELSTL